MPFVNFRKKFRFFSFDFLKNFDVRTFPRWLSKRGTKFFFERYPKNLFFKIFTLVLSDRFIDCFSKFWFFIGYICILIREPISLLAEHARKCLKVKYLGRIEYDCQKSCVSGPWDHKVSASPKKGKKKFHACVPLILHKPEDQSKRLAVRAYIKSYTYLSLVDEWVKFPGKTKKGGVIIPDDNITW